MLKTFGLIGCLISFPATAELYQWIDDKGQTQFSDQAPKSQPNLKPQNLQVNSAMPHEKPTAKPVKKTGPRVVVIGEDGPKTGCGTKELGITNHSGIWDSWQEKRWKDCHGMK